MYNIMHYHTSDESEKILSTVQTRDEAIKEIRRLANEAICRLQPNFSAQSQRSRTRIDLIFTGRRSGINWGESYYFEHAPDPIKLPTLEDYKELAIAYLKLRSEIEDCKAAEPNPDRTRALANLYKKQDRLLHKLIVGEPLGVESSVLINLWKELEDSIPND